MSRRDRIPNWMQRIIDNVMRRFRRRRNPARRPVIMELVDNVAHFRRDPAADNPGHSALHRPDQRKAQFISTEELQASTSDELLLSSHSSGRHTQSDYTDGSLVTRQLSTPPSTSHSGHIAREPSSANTPPSLSEERTEPSCSKEISECAILRSTSNRVRDLICTTKIFLRRSSSCQDSLMSLDSSGPERESQRRESALKPNQSRSTQAVEKICLEPPASRLRSPESSQTDDPSTTSPSSTLSSDFSREYLSPSRPAAKKSLSRSYPGTSAGSFGFVMPSTSGSVTCDLLPPPRMEESLLQPIDPQRPGMLPHGEQQQCPEEGAVAVVPVRPEPIPGSSGQQVQHIGRPVEMQPNQVVIRSPRRQSPEVVLRDQQIQVDEGDLERPAAIRRRFVRANDTSPPLNGFGLEGRENDDNLDEVFAP